MSQHSIQFIIHSKIILDDLALAEERNRYDDDDDDDYTSGTFRTIRAAGFSSQLLRV